MTETKIKHIAIAGAGGIGSNLVEILFDYGVNRNQFDFVGMQIDVYDDDIVETSNLLHQNFSEQDLHTLKVDSLANRFMITPVKRFMTKEDFNKYHLIFCAVDSMSFRKELYNWSFANPNKAFWIDGRCESRTCSVFNKSNSQELLKKMIDDSTERAGCLLKFEKEQQISHVVPRITAGIMAQEFLNYIRGITNMSEKIFLI